MLCSPKLSSWVSSSLISLNPFSNDFICLPNSAPISATSFALNSIPVVSDNASAFNSIALCASIFPSFNLALISEILFDSSSLIGFKFNLVFANLISSGVLPSSGLTNSLTTSLDLSIFVLNNPVPDNALVSKLVENDATSFTRESISFVNLSNLAAFSFGNKSLNPSNPFSALISATFPSEIPMSLKAFVNDVSFASIDFSNLIIFFVALSRANLVDLYLLLPLLINPFPLPNALIEPFNEPITWAPLTIPSSKLLKNTSPAPLNLPVSGFLNLSGLNVASIAVIADVPTANELTSPPKPIVPCNSFLPVVWVAAIYSSVAIFFNPFFTKSFLTFCASTPINPFAFSNPCFSSVSATPDLAFVAIISFTASSAPAPFRAAFVNIFPKPLPTQWADVPPTTIPNVSIDKMSAKPSPTVNALLAHMPPGNADHPDLIPLSNALNINIWDAADAVSTATLVTRFIFLTLFAHLYTS